MKSFLATTTFMIAPSRTNNGVGMNLPVKTKQQKISYSVEIDVKKKSKTYKTWSGVMNFLLKFPFENNTFITVRHLINDVEERSIIVYKRPRVYMSFTELRAANNSTEKTDRGTI